MGNRGIEAAFETYKNKEFLGWLIFQMDTALLEDEYCIDEEGLKKFEFKGLQPDEKF
ncbi:hypothetical protein JXL19_06375 [bacterium]|nr:hypothetical protein [bacterium]